MDKQTLLFLQLLRVTPWKAEGKNTSFSTLSSPPVLSWAKAVHWNYPNRHVVSENEEEAAENWALLASCVLEPDMGAVNTEMTPMIKDNVENHLKFIARQGQENTHLDKDLFLGLIDKIVSWKNLYIMY